MQRALSCLPALGILILSGATCDVQPGPPAGDAERGAVVFAVGDGSGPGCQACHGFDASGGGFLDAPNIQGKPYSEIDARTRGSEPHSGGKFDLSNQDVADLAAFLESVAGQG